MKEIIDESTTALLFYNDSGKNVTKYIENGKTRKFRSHKEACKYALSIRSYVYELYFEVIGKPTKRQYGFAVPK